MKGTESFKKVISDHLNKLAEEEEIAVKAVEYADALIKKLNETRNPNI